MNKISSMLLVSLAALLAVVSCQAQTDAPGNDILSFANSLYAQKDYYRAITEYKRFLFLQPSSPSAPAAEFQIGMSYMNGEKLETAVQIFSELADRHLGDETGRKAILMAGESYARLGKYREAQDALEKILARYPDSLENDAIKNKIGWYLVRQGETRMAAEIFSNCPSNSAFRSQAERLLKETAACKEIPRKMPALAGGLSAILPGAGQLYAGRPRDGLVAFLVNGALIWAAAESFDKDQNFTGAMFALLDVSWYAGNIYNAVNSTHKLNRSRLQDFLNNAEIKCGLTMSGREYGQIRPTLALQISF